MKRVFDVIVTAVLLTACSSSVNADVYRIVPTGETEPVASSGDAADDVCIWVHPDDAGLSLIIGTNKDGSLDVYGLDGRRIQTITAMLANNVDIRHELGEEGELDLVTVSDRADNSIGLFRVDAESRRLKPARHGDGLTGFDEIYGICMYRDPASGTTYVIPNSKDGEVQVWETSIQADGSVALKLVEEFDVGGQTEGCVADDRAGVLYIGEERVGIWRYDLRALIHEGDVERRLVDGVGPNGHLVADVEGLTLYLGEEGTGYLLVSSQGNHSYVVYRRDGRNEYVGTFRLVAGNGIDGTEETDGIDVCAAELGPGYEWGIFVAQDGLNDSGAQNFKMVPWQTIAETFEPPLSMSGADVRD